MERQLEKRDRSVKWTTRRESHIVQAEITRTMKSAIRIGFDSGNQLTNDHSKGEHVRLEWKLITDST